MRDHRNKPTGLALLIQKYRQEFETEENINYYSYKDFVRAERKYIKFALGNYTATGQSNHLP